MKRKATAAFVLFALLPLAACNELKKAAQAAADVASAAKIAETTVKDLTANGTLTKEESVKLDKIILLVVRGDEAFIAQAKTFTTYGKTQKQVLALSFKAVTDALAQLQTTINSIINANARTTLTIALTALQTAANVLVGLLRA